MALMGIDQHGDRWDEIDEKRPKASLLEKMGCRSAVPMYQDREDGTTYQCGYVVSAPRGRCWVTLYHVTVWEGKR